MMNSDCTVRFAKCMLFLSLFLFGCEPHTDGDEEQPDSNNAVEPPRLFPCWSQSWQCGDWRPLTYQLDAGECIESYTPDGKLLIRSMCGWCQSVRLVDPDERTERIILSFEGRVKQCEHRWEPAMHTRSFDPIRQGDMLFVVYGKQMHVLEVEEYSFFGQQISYAIAQVTDTGRFPTKVDLKKLIWRSGSASNSICVGSRKVDFGVGRVDIRGNGNPEEFVTISYDDYYGMMGSSTTVTHRLPAHIAIVHKPNIENSPVVDLTEFRFKTWEDGLGNRCDSVPPAGVDTLDKAVFLSAHNNAVRDVAISSDGKYVVSTGDDGKVVIQELDEPVTKIVGPFKKERLLCLAASRDAGTILAGGELNFFKSILKVNVADAKYEEIEIASTASMEGLFYCNDNTSIAYIAANTLSFFDLRANKLLSSHKIFGGITGSIAASINGKFFAVTSMNVVGDKGAEPCKLTIFDQKGNETLSYQFESCDEGYYSKITFLGDDFLVLCYPAGRMSQWKWWSQDEKWKIHKEVTIPEGPFSAIAGSPDAKTVWLAKDQSLLGINIFTGELVYESAFEINARKNEYLAEPITTIEAALKRNLLALGFCDGRIAIVPIPMGLSSRNP